MARALPTRTRQTPAWIVGALLLVGAGVPALRARDEAGPHPTPKTVAAMTGAKAEQVPDELMQVAQWLEPVISGSQPDKVSDAIRKDPASFKAFANRHDAKARAQALVDVPYGREIATAAKKHEVDPLLVASVVEVESTFEATAGSHKGAVGLMQLLPKTAGLSRKRLQNPAENLDAGSAYLASLIDRFDGDLRLALAAYNAGPRHVRNYEDVPPFPETQSYVEKVLSRYVQYHQELWQRDGVTQLVAAIS